MNRHDDLKGSYQLSVDWVTHKYCPWKFTKMCIFYLNVTELNIHHYHDIRY